MTSGGSQDSKDAQKSMSRRKSRRRAFELLFELELHDIEIEALLDRAFNDIEVQEIYLKDPDDEGFVTGGLGESSKKFITELIYAVKDNEKDLDHELSQYPHDWSYDRIGVPERVLLKLALAEMVYLGTSHKVVINETLDMAKLYAQEEARRFINGILGAVVKGMDKLQDQAKKDREE